ncbi:homeobox protein CDX-2 isoform 2-T2 [Anomaloglossus baeobatrachus]|uniref:homeobox protein CDX-2 isoform X2 n=1 Tax=Anomaloglossus baeobatrachus TaxID=238106 RepID=UPI003F504102
MKAEIPRAEGAAPGSEGRSQYAASWHQPATMYVSYLLEKDMYPGSMRGHPGLQNFSSAPQYPDYGGYHGLSLESAAPSGSPAWITPYGATREDWGHPTYPTGHTPLNPSPGGSLGYSPVSDYPTGQVQGPPCVGVLPAGHQPQMSPGMADGHRRHHYDWMRKPATQGNTAGGKTRTKDKYRVVYTDHQRLELEKEFHYSRYITIRRKAELAATLGLSERQVKIWFQNRRAKERKINKKRIQQSQNGPNDQDPLSPESSLSHMMPLPGTNVGTMANGVAQ